MEEIIGLKVNDNDNVAVVFAEDIKAGSKVHVRDKKGDIEVIKLLNDVPYGHKIAITTIDNGKPILKYGEEIGVATTDIAVGDHVHVQNMDSQRGRGDK